VIGSQRIIVVYILCLYLKERALMAIHEVAIKLLIIATVPVIGRIEGDIGNLVIGKIKSHIRNFIVGINIYPDFPDRKVTERLGGAKYFHIFNPD